MQTIINRLETWCNSVGLMLNHEKTKYMVIRKSCNKKIVSEKLFCSGNEIERVNVHKYLGIFIDDNFSFKTHSEFVLSKISANAGVINKLKRMLTPHMLTLLINAHINSIIDYCLPVWGPSRICDFPKIQNVTNNLLATFYFPNIVKFKKKRFWSDRSVSEFAQAKRECVLAHKNINYFNLLEKSNLFTVTERLQYYSLLNIFKIRKFGSKITELNEMYGVKESISSHVTRSSQNCNVLPHKSTLYEKSNLYYSTSLWNSIPKSLHEKNMSNLCFKSSLTDWLLNNRDNVFV
jgi:hypothetical protein